MTTLAQRFGATFSLVSRTAGARFVERALPSWIGLALAASVLFGPTAIQPADIARAAHGSAWLRAGLFGGWTLLAAPLTAEILRDRRADFLRAAPGARASSFAAAGLWMLAAQVPFSLLWAAANGPVAGVAALVFGAGLCAAITSPARSILKVLTIAGAALAVAVDASPVAMLALSPLSIASLHEAWRRAPERATIAGAAVRGPALLAIAIAHAMRLARSERVAAGRAIVASVAAGVVGALAVRNGGHEAGSAAAGRVFLTAFGAVSAIGAGAIAAPVRAADASLATLLRSTGTRRSLQSGARILAAGAFMGGAGLAGVAAWQWLNPLGLRIIVAAPALAALLGAAVVEIDVRIRAARGAAKDRGGRTVLIMLGVAITGALLASALGELAVVVLGAAGLAVVLIERLREGSSSSSRPRAPASMALVVAGVKKRFGGREVLRGASLELARGSVGWLRGENGSGKSTLLKVVAGVLGPDDGEVRVGGDIGYAPDAGELPDHLSVAELLSLVAALKDAAREDASPAANASGVLGVRALLGERLSTLSLGQRRRVAIASALVGDPLVLLLDEPTNGLDAEGLTELERLLDARRSVGKSVLFASHEGDVAPRVSDVYWTMVEGALGSPIAAHQ